MILKIGDIVRTKKGCRVGGNPGKLKIIKLGLKNNGYDAALCEYLSIKRNSRLFNIKNLEKIK